MSDEPQEPDAGAQDGGYGYPTLEQEVTPEVLEGGAASGGDAPRAGTEPAEDSGEGDTPAPGEVEADPPAVEPPD